MADRKTDRKMFDKKTKTKVYKDYAYGMTFKQLSEKYNIPQSTIKTWKQKEDWKRVEKLPGGRGNVNAVGNRGGNGAPKGNKYGEKYGFYSKYLPPDMLEIVMDLQEKSILDIQEEQIELQYSAILRAQKIMQVEFGEIVKTIVSESENGVSYDVQYYWDRYDRYLNAQSRAMGTLNTMIRNYEEAIKATEEAAEVREERQARIAKIKAETARIKEEDRDKKNPTINVVMSSEVASYAK